jgi:hydroxymethylglutaryl-CoA reductase
MNEKRTSRISKFYKKTLDERLNSIRNWLNIETDAGLSGMEGITPEKADQMIENVIGVFNLPFGIATNFLINGRDYLIPMVIEEPSVVAGASNAARLFREGGGFSTSSDKPVMIGQIQILDIPDINKAIAAIEEKKLSLLETVDKLDPVIVKFGGGARDFETRVFEDTPIGPMLVLHLHYDSRDAMGANTINTALESISPKIEQITGGRVNLRILSNLADKRKARAGGMIPAAMLSRPDLPGVDVVKAIVEAGVFASVDPYRAATHNKGIMNGIDPVVIATGNDWRAIEAGAHAYAARDKRYTSLTKWWQDDKGNLCGSIELPMAIGTVGGATRVHPTAQLALKILAVESARELAEVIAAVGLAQNLAAIRALATDGIQHGHMRLHARQIATAAGASPEHIGEIVQKMIEENNIRLERAEMLVQEIQQKAE